jgi:uncharacterized protein (DUF58 family)
MLSRSFIFGLVVLLILSLALLSPLLFLLTMLLAFVAGASWLWDRYSLRGVSYARQFGSQRLFCGEATDLWVEIVNAKPLPLAWLKVQDEFPDVVALDKAKLTPAGESHRRLLTNLFNIRWYERVRRHYHLQTTRRGVFDFGPVALASGDIFGFRARRLEVDHRHTLTVYPKVVPFQKLNLQPARPLGENNTIRRLIADPLKLAGVRDYLPGDNIRHIHWKATARRGTLQTKQFDPSASQQLFICLNMQSLESHYGGILVDELETAIVAAASLGHAALEARIPIGLISNGTLRNADGLARLPASRHSDHELRLLDLLAQITYFTNIHFDQLLQAEASSLPYGATLIVITTLLNDSIQTQVLNLRRAGHPVAIILVDTQYHRLSNQSSNHPATSAQLPIYHLTQNWTDLEAIKLD